MEKFEIYYNNGTYNCFYRIEEFEDYETAKRVVIELNEYGVSRPEIIKITRL